MKINKEIASMTIAGKTYSIETSNHAAERMVERNVDAYVVAGSVLALGPARIDALQAEREDAMIIDKENNIAVVVALRPNEITIVTVINKSNVFVKDNTTICNI